MGEGEPTPPIWRTWLAAAMAAWMLLVVGGVIGVWAALETAPLSVVLSAAALLALAGPLLLAAALWAMMRDPVTGWIAPSAMLFFLGGLAPAFQPLSDWGARLNFERHRAVYETVVAEARDSRLAPNAAGWVEGRREDVRFRYHSGRPTRIEFAWTQAPFASGVRYDEQRCTPSAELACLDRGRALDGAYFHYAAGIADLTFRR